MISRALNAAVLKPFILSLLARGDSYGYEIIQHVHDLTGGRIEWTAGTLYPVLHSLESDGLLESYWQPAQQGPRRKFYRITSAGHKALRTEQADWVSVFRAMSSLWSGSLPAPQKA